MIKATPQTLRIVLCSLLILAASIGRTCFVGAYADFVTVLMWLPFYSAIVFFVFSKLQLGKGILILSYASWLIRLVMIPLDIYFEIARSGDQLSFLLSGKNIILGNDFLERTGFGRLIACEFRIFGISDYLPRSTNSFIVMLGIAAAMRSMEKLNLEKKTIKICSAILLLSPFTILFSITALRDPLYFFSISCSLLIFIDWIKEKKLKYLILATLVMTPSVILHSGNICVVFPYALLFFVYMPGKRTNKYAIRVLLILGCILASMVLFSTRRDLGYFTALQNKNGLYAGFKAFIDRSNVANVQEARSAYLVWTIDFVNTWQILLYTPLRMIYVLLSPMIWDISTFSDLIAFSMDSLIFLAFIGIQIVYFVKRFKTPTPLKKVDYDKYMFLKCGNWIVFVFSVLFGWGTVTAGTAIRHRNFLLVPICIMMGICWDVIKKNVRN